MKFRYKYLLILFLLIQAFNSLGQSSIEDSLTAAIFSTSDKHDKIMLMAELGIVLYDHEPEKSLELALQANEIAESEEDQVFAMNFLGNAYLHLEVYDSALHWFQTTYSLAEEIGDSVSLSKAINNLGVVYFNTGDLNKGLEAFEESAQIDLDVKDFESAMISFLNLGAIYMQLQEYELAAAFSSKALKLSRKTFDKKMEAHILTNLGAISIRMGREEEGKDQFFEAMEIYRNMNDIDGILSTYYNLGFTLNITDNPKIAEIYFLKALEFADTLQSAKAYSDVYLGLAETNESMGKYGRSLDYYKLHMAWSDTLVQQIKQDAIVEMQERFNTEQTQKENELLQKENQIKSLKNRENESKLNQSRFIIIGVSAGLLLILAMVFVLINRNRLKTKTNRLLSLQRDEILEQKKEITDSITYAKRIQNSFLPAEKDFKAHFSESFLMYEPKDIVAGDFYILEEAGDYVFFSVADCTGHGVPGAMVSIVCSNAIRKVLHEMHEYEPGKILNHTRDIVISQFERKGHTVNDGMDISFCRFDKKNMTLAWAGANNDLLIIRKGEAQMLEIKPNKQPIGGYVTTDPFTTHEVQVEKGDCVYMTSDGFPDQFGGEKGKKYKYKRFKELLLRHSQLKMIDQKSKISTEFWEWKQGFEQIDDVCVMGVRI